MKKNSWINRIAVLFAAVALITGGCGKGPSAALSEGASEFADGKEETDYAFHSTNEILTRLMDDFSGSYGRPSGNAVTDDDAKDAVDKAEDEQIIDKSKEDDPVIKSDDELKQLMHEMLTDTKEVAVFTLDSGYSLDADTINDLYDQLVYEDAYDVICLTSFTWGMVGNSWELSFEYSIDADTLKSMKSEERTLVSQAKKDVEAILGDRSSSEYDIVCAVNDYLCDEVVYPEQDLNAYPNDGYAPESHTAYSALKKGSAVCDGYSKAAKLLLNEFGIECGVEVGECVNGSGHAWNLVKVDGSWYQMDVTWNDGSSEFDASGRTLYLLVTDDYMKQSRTWEESWYPSTPSKPYR